MELEKDMETTTKSFIQRVKIATALAVIRSKPPGESIECHIAHLSEAVLKTIHDRSADARLVDQILQQLQKGLSNEAVNEGEISNIQPLNSMLSSEHPKHQTLVEFFRNRSQLINFGLPNDHPCNEEHFRKTLVVISTTLDQLRSGFGLKLPLELVQQTLDVIFNVSKVDNTKEQFIPCILKFLDDLMSDILGSNEINDGDLQRRRSLMIQILAKHDILFLPILEQMIGRISIFVRAFTCSFNSVDNYCSSMIEAENMYFVLHAVEKVLDSKYCATRTSISTTPIQLSRDTELAWKSIIDECMMIIESRLPLLAIYIWQIHWQIFMSNE